MGTIDRIVDELVVLVWELFVDGLLGAPGSNPYPALAGELGWEPFEAEDLFEEIGAQPWEIVEELCEGDPLDFFKGVDSERKESSRGGKR